MAEKIDRLADVIDELERQCGEINEFYEAIQRLRSMQIEIGEISQKLHTSIQTNASIAKDLQPITKDVTTAVNVVKIELDKVLEENRISQEILEEISEHRINELSQQIIVAKNDLTEKIKIYNENSTSEMNQGNKSIIKNINSSNEDIQLQLSRNAKSHMVSNVLIVILLLLTAGNLIYSL